MTIRFERLLDYNVHEVWDAITRPELMAVWLGQMEMALVPGSPLTLRMADEAGSVMTGKVMQVVPDQLLEYTWDNENAPAEIIRWELFPAGADQCRLIMTHRRVADGFARMVLIGWHIFLDHLQGTLNGKRDPYPYENPEEEEQVRAVYAAMG